MKGFAQALFDKREGEVKEAEKYPFSEIDRFFAESLLHGESEEQKLFASALLWASRQGHLSLPLCTKELSLLFAPFENSSKLADALIKGASELSPRLLSDAVESPETPFCRFQNYYYLQKNWFFETRFLRELERLLREPAETVHLDFHDLQINEEQKRAIAGALSRPFSVICGGPGTGKTYAASRIVRAFKEKWPDARIALAAPTGKAAKQLQHHLGSLDIQVTTLHALLNVHRESDYSKEPSPLMLDLLIVDECSMIDARLFSELLRAIRKNTHLVLIGDPDQLPPVETGTLFADLVDLLQERSPAHLSKLTRIVRCESEEILKFAEAIKSGDINRVWETVSSEHGTHSEALSLISLDQEKIWKEACDFFPKPTSRAVDPENLSKEKARFCLLSCLRKGALGVDELNALFAKRFMAKLKKGEVLALPILITRTDAALGLCNGETGFLIRHFREDGEEEQAQEGAKEIDYAIFGPAPFKKIPLYKLPSYEWAYCLSVHKSQGSEYENVLLIAGPGAEHFGREVLYTGATRCKKSLKIASNREILEKALGHASRKISALHARLQKSLSVG